MYLESSLSRSSLKITALSATLTASLSCHLTAILFHVFAKSLLLLLVKMWSAALMVRLMSLSMSLVCGVKWILCGGLPKYTVLLLASQIVTGHCLL